MALNGLTKIVFKLAHKLSLFLHSLCTYRLRLSCIFFVHCQFFFICHTLPSCKRTLLLAGTWLRVLVSPVLPHLRVLRCAQLFENSSPRRYAAAVAIERKRIIFEEDAKKQDFRRVLELNSD